MQVAEQSRHQQELQQKLEATTLMWQQRVAAVDKELIDTKTAQVWLDKLLKNRRRFDMYSSNAKIGSTFSPGRRLSWALFKRLQRDYNVVYYYYFF